MPDMTQFTEEQKAEIKGLVHEALVEFFAAKGTLTKNVLVTTAIVLTALATIGLSIKWILGFIGFTYISK